jgi:hypothetical protein
MNESPYKISGLERRVKKKELVELKRYVRNFWLYEDINRVYGGGLTKEQANNAIYKAKLQIESLERQLLEPSKQIKREEILSKLIDEEL